MTFNFAPWAIDGARTTAGLARLSAYASGGGRSGVIRPLDLRVKALSVPGNGLQIMAGGATILNHYLSDPDEAYVVSNPATHTVLASSMPSAKPASSYYLVCVVVGDPEFNQTGHPYMPSGPIDPALAADFEYVRVVIVPCDANTTRFEDLGYNYPAYALARLEVPANTTTITNAMIVDLRQLSKPRTESTLLLGRQTTQRVVDVNTSPGSIWINLTPAYLPFVSIPSWATRMQILTHVSGLGNQGAAVGELRTAHGTSVGPVETYDMDDVGSRTNLMTVFDQDVSAIAGSTIQLLIQARQLFDQVGYAFSDARTQIAFDVRFSETVR